jgi:hypothetical protein
VASLLANSSWKSDWKNRVRAYFDSSALAKRYIVEPGTAEVLKHCSNASEILLSILCIPELISAFNRLAREKKITRIQYKPTRCINLLRVIMKTPVRIASQCNYEAASGDHFWRPSTSVIPGLTRNPGFLSGFPPSRE